MWYVITGMFAEVYSDFRFAHHYYFVRVSNLRITICSRFERPDENRQRLDVK